jgi:hypothetical protein
MNHRWLISAAALIIALPFSAAAQHDHAQSTVPAAKVATEKKALAPLKPAEGASIKILAPAKEEQFSGTYLLRGSLPEGVRQLSLTYDFRLLK